MITYLVSIFGVQEIMKDRKPMSACFKHVLARVQVVTIATVTTELKPLFMLHNVLLSSGSALLLVLMIEEVRPFFCLFTWLREADWENTLAGTYHLS